MENKNTNTNSNVIISTSAFDESKLNLQTLFYVLRRKLVWIIACGILVALIFALYTTFFITPIYSSTAKFYVNNKADQSSHYISSADVNASQSLAETSIVIIKNNTELLNTVAEGSGVDISGSSLKGMISASVDNGTEVFYIRVSGPSPENCYKLAQSFQKVIPTEIPEKIIEGVTIKAFDAPKAPTYPDSPNRFSNTVIGGAIGVALSFIFFFFREVLDTTIYTEEEIKERFKYPIIGVIPTISSNSSDEKILSKKTKKNKEAK